MLIPTNTKDDIFTALDEYQNYCDGLRTTSLKADKWDDVDYATLYLQCGDVRRALTKRNNIKHSYYLVIRRACMWYYSNNWDNESPLYKFLFKAIQ